MIETTSVEAPTKGFSAGPASRNICGFDRDHQCRDIADFFRRGIEANAFCRQRADLLGRMRLDHRNTRGSSPPASQPVSIAPPILPAPARTMVPVICLSALADDIRKTPPSSLRTQGPVRAGRYSLSRVICNKHRATQLPSRSMDPCFRRDDGGVFRMSSASALKQITGPLVLVGAGKMGGAMLRAGWRAASPPTRRGVRAAAVGRDQRAGGRASVSIQPRRSASAATLVVAVKPQFVPRGRSRHGRSSSRGRWWSRSWPGKTIASARRALPPAAIVRAMPNTPAAIGRGITVAVAPGNVGVAQRAARPRAAAAAGSVEWVDDENLMDAVTAVSGSAPPMFSCWPRSWRRPASRPACRPSLPPGWRARRSPAPANCCIAPDRRRDLRQNVTSPGGTTAAALDVLMGDGRPAAADDPRGRGGDEAVEGIAK